MKTCKLPQTDSIEELAKFWDIHDLTDFEDQLEEVTEPIFEREPAAVMKIHFQPQEIEAVKRIAESRGIEQSVLIREWVLEKLRDLQSAG
jgi:CopG antitoxin of type II toxin-antitoxin system